MSVAIGALLLIGAHFAQAQTYTPQTPTTGPYDGSAVVSPDIPLTDPRLSRKVTGDVPEQINLIYASPTSVIVRWSTGAYKNSSGVPGVLTANQNAGVCGPVSNNLLYCENNQCYPQGQYNCVNKFLCPVGTCICGANTCYTSQYGCKNGQLTQNPADNGGFCPTPTSTLSIVNYGPSTSMGSVAYGGGSSYTMNPAIMAGSIYVSGLLHQTTLTGLSPSTTYYYTVGDGRAATTSAQLSFTTLQAVTPSFSQYRLGVFADLGLTENSSVTVQHLVQSNSNAFVNIGDFVYADNFSPNAADRWDGYYRFLQQFLAGAPMIACEGNHEIETQTDGTTFAAYKARFGNAVSQLGGSNSPFYYSVDIPGAHVISLGAYTEYAVNGPQYTWLQQDLAKVNRAVTPFIIAISHPPVYNTYRSHYKEVECMRQAFETLYYQYGIDLILYGHVHSYERTNRVYNYLVDPCGPTHITVGDGGNDEGLQTLFVDTNTGTAAAPAYANCPAPNSARCPTYQNADKGGGQNGFCPPSQPAWSAFRESAFGHGTLDITPTSLTWQWHRNQDGEPVVTDTITINKGSFVQNNGAKCANHP